MSEQVTVQVTITERVRYSTFVKMARKEFEELETALDSEHGRELRRLEQRIGEYCDRRDDWQDADDLEVEEFCIVTNEEAA